MYKGKLRILSPDDGIVNIVQLSRTRAKVLLSQHLHDQFNKYDKDEFDDY